MVIIIIFFFYQIVLWDVYGDCMNFDVLIGHKNAVVQVDWSTDGQTLYSASADKTLGFWDFIVRFFEPRYIFH